jgi:hypothetical protein
MEILSVIFLISINNIGGIMMKVSIFPIFLNVLIALSFFTITIPAYSHEWHYRHIYSSPSEKTLSATFIIETTPTTVLGIEGTRITDKYFNTNSRSRGVVRFEKNSVVYLEDREGFLMANKPKINLKPGSVLERSSDFEISILDGVQDIKDHKNKKYKCWMLLTKSWTGDQDISEKKYIDIDTGWMIRTELSIETKGIINMHLYTLTSTSANQGKWNPNWW